MLGLLYEATMKGVAPGDLLGELSVQPDEFTCRLLKGATAHKDEADALVSAASLDWPLERMAVVDRLILHLAIAELLDPEGPPRAVVIDEAVELAKAYSTEESGRFVNGILATVSARLS